MTVRAGGLVAVLGALVVVLGALVVGEAGRLVVAVGDGDGGRDVPDEADVAVPAPFPPPTLPMTPRRRRVNPTQLTT